jgi:hypothetical protein
LESIKRRRRRGTMKRRYGLKGRKQRNTRVREGEVSRRRRHHLPPSTNPPTKHMAKRGDTIIDFLSPCVVYGWLVAPSSSQLKSYTLLEKRSPEIYYLRMIDRIRYMK